METYQKCFFLNWKCLTIGSYDNNVSNIQLFVWSINGGHLIMKSNSSQEACNNLVLGKFKAAVRNFFGLKMIRNQYFRKYITNQCSKLSPYFSSIHNG